MNNPGSVTEGVVGDTLGHKIRAGRSLLFMLTGALIMAACGGAGFAPVAERSTVGTGGSQAAGISGGTAGPEVSDGDWTATVRPLGDPGSTASRELATTAGTQEVGQRRERLPSEQPVAGVAPASSGGGGAAAAPAARAAPPPAPLQSSAAAPGTALPPASLQSSAANPAVVSLLNTASAQSRAGDHARAAATLERAIAIEPDNAWLWYRLADTRLAEGRLSQAASLAAKSNSLAISDRGLQADNWRLIAEARRRQGDTGAAAAAESQAARLSN